MFKLIPMWVYAVAAIAVMAIIGLQQIHISQLNSKYDRHIAADLKAEVKAKEAKAEDERQTRIRNEARDQYEADQLALAQSNLLAAGESKRLLDTAVTTVVSQARKACPAPLGPTVPGGDPIGMLADLYDRIDRAAGIYAKVADERAARASGCEARYDNLP